MKALSLFSGIGGLDISALLNDIDILNFCEIDKYNKDILNLRFTDIPIISDVKIINGNTYKNIDLIYGGFPCQDLSVAGKQKGLNGERSGLWFEMFRIIRESRPYFIIIENVYGAVQTALPTIQDCLEGEKYKIWSFVIPAYAFGTSHKRERLFVVAIREDIYTKLLSVLSNITISNISFNEINKLMYNFDMNNDYKYWATPNTKDWFPQRSYSSLYKMMNISRKGRKYPCNLREQVNKKLLQIMCSNLEYDNTSKTIVGEDDIYLNINWVESLMGFYLDWTNINCDYKFNDIKTYFYNHIFPEPMKLGYWDEDKDNIYIVNKESIKDFKLYKNRIIALGNSVVPQQCYPIFKVIKYLNDLL